MAYKLPPLTLEKMADVVEDTRAIENVMGKFTFLTCYKRYTEQFEKYWTEKEPTLTFEDEGYEGYKAVKECFVDYNNEQTRWANEVMRKLYPAELGGKSDEEIWGVGSNTVLTFTTPLIEIALDGQTAKGLWYIMGATTEVYSAGPKAGWYFGRCGVDFVKEDGQWKIWHMRWCPDFKTPLDGNWTKNKLPPHEGIEYPEPTKKGEFYRSYDANYIAEVNPPLPEPYDTFANTFSY